MKVLYIDFRFEEIIELSSFYLRYNVKDSIERIFFTTGLVYGATL